MRRIAGALVALLLAGCGLVEDLTPDEATLVVEGEAGKEVRIIVSTDFVAAVTEEGITRVVILTSDTLVTTLPYRHSYRIQETQRFYAEAARLDTDLESVHMEVAIDDRVQFAEGGVLLEGQPYRFVYTFNQAITREILVL